MSLLSKALGFGVRAIEEGEGSALRGAEHAAPRRTLAVPSRDVALPNRTATVNIGLKPSEHIGGPPLTRKEVVTALKQRGHQVSNVAVHQSATEPTLIADVYPPVPREALHDLSAELRQDAIAQHRGGGAGDLEGPRAADWGDFNPDYFMHQSGLPLTDVLATSSDAPAESDLAVAKGAPDVSNAPGSRTFAQVREGAPPERATAVTRVPLRESSPDMPAGVSGSYDASANVPLTYKGLQPWELSSSQVADMGEALGVPNLGPLSDPKTFKYTSGDEFQVPGGLEGNFTYEDMLKLKASGINPDRIDPSLHQELQAKLMRSMAEPQGGLSDARVAQGLHFGMTSPNQPLFPNQLAMSRLRPASQEELGRATALRPWALNDPVTTAQRKAASADIASAYGLNAGAAGGLGISGSVDYSRLADLNDMMSRDPAFFHRGKGENWTDFVERVNSQVPGLGNKTTSFGLAWQPDAAVSAIDRHMVRKYADTLLADPGRRAAFEGRVLNLAQRRALAAGREAPTHFGQVGDGLLQESLLAEVGKSPSVNLRTSKGLISPSVPENLASTDWIAEPLKIERMGSDYKDIVAANEAASAGSGLHLFGNQWNVWDRIRRRLEPHENMFPGLELVPRMSVDQLSVANRQHALSGHKNYTKEIVEGDPRLQPTREVDYEPLRYFKVGGPVRRVSRSLSVARN